MDDRRGDLHGPRPGAHQGHRGGLDPGHAGGAAPFAGRVFRYRAAPGAVDRDTGRRVGPPPDLVKAQTLDYILTRYPGYTLRTLLEEDAHELLMMLNLLDPDLGKAPE